MLIHGRIDDRDRWNDVLLAIYRVLMLNRLKDYGSFMLV